MIKLDPKNEEGYIRKAEAYLGEGQYNLAK